MPWEREIYISMLQQHLEEERLKHQHKHEYHLKLDPVFSEKNYERYVSELTTEGTIAGEKLTPEERKEGFKKKGDKINFKNFLEKVLERLPPDAQKKITEVGINRVNFDRYGKRYLLMM